MPSIYNQEAVYPTKRSRPVRNIGSPKKFGLS
nr:MAG TPA: hypothetical protein [Caudoviricetes sp.]DAT08637.1 MAG TPA: hypothetical protein [Caudoviricetes sp.]